MRLPLDVLLGPPEETTQENVHVHHNILRQRSQTFLRETARIVNFNDTLAEHPEVEAGVGFDYSINWADGSVPLTVRKLASGLVVMAGYIEASPGATNPALILRTGYRPTKVQTRLILNPAGIAFMSVFTNGAINSSSIVDPGDYIMDMCHPWVAAS